VLILWTEGTTKGDKNTQTTNTERQSLLWVGSEVSSFLTVAPLEPLSWAGPFMLNELGGDAVVIPWQQQQRLFTQPEDNKSSREIKKCLKRQQQQQQVEAIARMPRQMFEVLLANNFQIADAHLFEHVSHYHHHHHPTSSLGI
jgi:hypothetical protein